MSVEIIGSREKAIAIIENGNKEIAEEIIKKNKNVKTVLNKVSERKGVYRLEEYEILIGDENTEVVHVEYGLKFKVDPRKVYFSSRESTERQRIVSLVNDGEEILVMFSGVAPIAISIVKKKNVKVYCIEINEIAHQYAKENVKLNKVEDKVFLFLGDVFDVCKNQLKDFCFDRIIMPIINSLDYIDLAIEKCKKNGYIHSYFVSEKNNFEMIEKIANEKGLKIVNVTKVSKYSPGKIKYRVDFIKNGRY